MIAIDTNVLLRYLLADDAKQFRKAKTLIETRRPVLITDVVLTETVWTLTGKRYQLDKTGICEVVRGMIADGAFRFEDNQVVWSALMDYEEAKPVRGKALDFPDALIIHKALFVADQKHQALEGFYSFDKALEPLKKAVLL
ncbi:type II toxin-antitoxin system VapC family toxin [uncultured Microbulbifer sp.]|uniref:PIN domain-containing protein n=1 Tax=uncultured Microbulbifer sp. TaxID=348147 RepID=UPI00260F72D9|nr:type II toxin-antitoxin system VapC family toxin [uncultured Microbulbifer sp.]